MKSDAYAKINKIRLKLIGWEEKTESDPESAIMNRILFEGKHELLFLNEVIAKERVNDVLEFIGECVKNKELDLSSLELVCYASFALICILMRKLDDEKQIEKVIGDINDGLDKLPIKEDDRKYLKIIWNIALKKRDYTRKFICNEWREEDEENYNTDMQNLLRQASEINPKGEIIELFREIELVEGFFKDPSDDNFEKMRKECFSRNGNWIGHILGNEFFADREIDYSGEELIPYIEINTSADNRQGLWDGIDDDELEENVYYRTFSLPYIVTTTLSWGDIWKEMTRMLWIANDNQAKMKEELNVKNKKLERLREQNRKMIDQVAHSWGNECYPEIVKNVAEQLLQKGDNSLANKLFKAYNSENNLMGEIIFLQAALADEPTKLQEMFKDSFFISGEGKKERKVQTVLEETLEILVFGLMNYKGDNEKRNICRDNLCRKHSLQKLVDDYAGRFEKTMPKDSFLKWFSENVITTEVKIDETWQSINLGQKEHGRIILKSIFRELITNVLFHGRSACKILLESTEDKMYIIIRNEVSERTKGSEKGLRSMKETVAKLNYDTSVSDEECVQYHLTKDSVFETKVTFAKELMYIDEEW